MFLEQINCQQLSMKFTIELLFSDVLGTYDETNFSTRLYRQKTFTSLQFGRRLTGLYKDFVSRIDTRPI